MLVLSRKCAEKLIVGGDLVLNVVEIRGQRVRLGLVPLSGQPLELHNDAEADEETVPEVSFVGGSSQLLVWSRFGSGLRINESVHVRILAIDPERVRLGIVAPCEMPIHRAESESEQASRVSRVTPEVLSDWVARKITAYLKEQPRGALQKLAQACGVSAVSITRWRKRQTNVATEHLHLLLPALGLGLEDLARELNADQVLLPDIPARGPTSRGEEGPSIRS